MLGFRSLTNPPEKSPKESDEHLATCKVYSWSSSEMVSMLATTLSSLLINSDYLIRAEYSAS